jgi:hypothetical protein
VSDLRHHTWRPDGRGNKRTKQLEELSLYSFVVGDGAETPPLRRGAQTRAECLSR